MRPQQRLTLPLADILSEIVPLLPGEPGLDALDPALSARGVSMSAAEVEPGDLFLGVPGARFHGAAFAEQARANGAVAILTDAAGAALIRENGVDLPLLVSTVSPREFAGKLASRVYGTADLHALTLGITGTNGKTSTAHFLDAIMRQLGLITGLSSTAERRIGDQAVISHLTTPEAPEVHALLGTMIEAGVDAAIIEVSAHALTRHRIDGVSFDVVGFTNLSHDHLDDYGTMDNYLAAKQELFTPEYARRAVVCLDTPAGLTVRDQATVPVTTIGTTGVLTPGIVADWMVTIENENPRFTEFRVDHPALGALRTRIPLIGAHMASNAGLAIAMLAEAGLSLATIGSALAADGQIDAHLPGRLVRVSGESGPTVFVDSGHTPDAIEKSLHAVRQVTAGKVIMISGADGERDPSKREDMGAAAAAGSDLLIITDHHSRRENPGEIRAALIAGARTRTTADHILEVATPEKAIRAAIERAGATDTILWCGLASQDYRDVDGVERPFDVAEESRRALREHGYDA
ncbi:UDP-N-acetylmuramoyl-L-alanyl-D-glutamate--2,6-diaminopimelate ligase [Mycetocola tolaasinivorans]|uniref:UDP-N-acetylmuramoyl-L-alanyl-D-glutamate--2, 6-diaminopimelate ligase n=1 Tax=Mycetocola tolaasinivorans TaxID=76635 RepID=A0A3L7A3H1_9MICO|nr:UDP-N-acetylmuramoyl-L-alanyl-D-glutamate--2,6-diaminopimelate ligase [Mycetocola tolaasinivorans]RLP74809.1 UDP-N-acetylmuramoyl-L-alanyl-D-glutamate--2,6-diaminopimelate ligase [Mycetocola tolaasinivorans]